MNYDVRYYSSFIVSAFLLKFRAWKCDFQNADWFLSGDGRAETSDALESGLPPLGENIQPQLHQRSQQHGPQRYAHERQLHVRQLLQLGTQRQAEGQLQEHGRQVPGTQTQVGGAVPRVIAGLAAACHLDGEHEDEDAIKHPNGEEDEEPVPLHLLGENAPIIEWYGSTIITASKSRRLSFKK